MSLINDALKRARETQRNVAPSGPPPLPPVETPARSGAGWILAASAILFLGAAGFVLGPTLLRGRVSPPPVAKAPGISTPPRPAAAPAPAVPAGIMPVAANVNPPPPVNTNAPAASNTNQPPPVAVEKMPRVQGIIFNSAQPLAIVNGQTVSVGDHAGNFQVKQITQNTVVFQRPDGTQKTLGIGE